MILFTSNWNPPEQRGVVRHEIRLRVDGYAFIHDGSSGAAGDRVESVGSPKLHNGTKLVSERFQTVPRRSDPAASHGKFAAAA